MTTYRRIVHVESGQAILPRAQWCNTFGARMRGFTFRRHLGEQDGLVIVEYGDSRIATGITMFFVSFPLGVIWVNDAGQVAGTVVAKPWRLMYFPPAPARYTIEGPPRLAAAVAPGDHIRFEACI